MVAIALLYSVVKTFEPSHLPSLLCALKSDFDGVGTRLKLTATIVTSRPFCRSFVFAPRGAPWMKMLSFSRTIEIGIEKICGCRGVEICLVCEFKSADFVRKFALLDF